MSHDSESAIVHTLASTLRPSLIGPFATLYSFSQPLNKTAKS
jgi:hypothetical protein